MMEIGDIIYVVEKSESLGQHRGVWVTVVRKKRITTPSVIKPTTIVRDDMWEYLVTEPGWFGMLLGRTLESEVKKAENHAAKVIWKLEKSDYDIRRCAK